MTGCRDVGETLKLVNPAKYLKGDRIPDQNLYRREKRGAVYILGRKSCGQITKSENSWTPQEKYLGLARKCNFIKFIKL